MRYSLADFSFIKDIKYIFGSIIGNEIEPDFFLVNIGARCLFPSGHARTLFYIFNLFVIYSNIFAKSTLIWNVKRFVGN